MRQWAVGGALFGGMGVLMFAHFYLDVVARGGSTPLLKTLIEEMTAALGTAFFFPGIVWAARRFPLDRAGWARGLVAHLALLGAFSTLHTTLNWASRALLFPLAGLGAYDYGALPARYAMELPTDLLVYAATVGFTHLFDHYRAARERAVQLAQMEARLARARLQNLQAQLNPHFLFNVLNTISSVMYEDVARADATLSRLCDLLRRALLAGDQQEVTLGEELEVLGLYLDVMEARFGDRLRVEVDADEGARMALVPTLILQPLVENALRHGTPAPPRAARVRVRARRRGDTLELEVEDNGPGPGAHPLLPGVGLSNTAGRLRGLYGEAGTIELATRAEGGARAALRIPFHTYPAAAPWSASVS